MMGDGDLRIRTMRRMEIEKVRRLLKGMSFPDKIFFPAEFKSNLKQIRKGKGTCLVAVLDGKIVGMIALNFSIIQGKRHGLIDIVATDKDARSKGVGKSLLTAGMAWYKRKGCRDVYAFVNRYNSPSWNMLTHFGFFEYSLSSQVKDHGIASLKLWPFMSYIFGIGVFKMKKEFPGQKKRKTNSTRQFITAWFITSLIWMLVAFRKGFSAGLFPYVLLIAGLSMLATELAHVAMARRHGLRMVFRAWYPGLLLSILIVSIEGMWLAYGSVYIRQTDWNYVKDTKTNGAIYVMGPIANIMMILACAMLIPFAGSQQYVDMLTLGYEMNILMTILNLLPIAGPGGFAWDGMKIFRWNKLIWLAIVVALAAIIVTRRIGAF